MISTINAGTMDLRLQMLERTLRQLRVQYARYFVGETQEPPFWLERSIAGDVKTLEQLPQTNSVHAAKIEKLSNQFDSYQIYWFETAQNISEGRDLWNDRMDDRRRNPLHRSNQRPATTPEPQ